MAKKPAKKQTPMMRQYDEIKAKHPEAMLLFRVGDFYETFGSDAEKASKTWLWRASRTTRYRPICQNWLKAATA